VVVGVGDEQQPNSQQASAALGKAVIPNKPAIPADAHFSERDMITTLEKKEICPVLVMKSSSRL